MRGYASVVRLSLQFKIDHKALLNVLKQATINSRFYQSAFYQELFYFLL